MVRGVDTTLLALLALLLGLFLGHVPGVLLLAQAGFSVVCTYGDVLKCEIAAKTSRLVPMSVGGEVYQILRNTQ